MAQGGRVLGVAVADRVRDYFLPAIFLPATALGFSPRSHSAKRDGRFGNSAQERDVKRPGVPRAARPSITAAEDKPIILAKDI
jgi:hypothetical protein